MSSVYSLLVLLSSARPTLLASVSCLTIFANKIMKVENWRETMLSSPNKNVLVQLHGRGRGKAHSGVPDASMSWGRGASLSPTQLKWNWYG
jgi:hypothetical protein